MRAWWLRGVKLGLLGILAMAAIFLGGKGLANREAPPVPKEELQERYDKALGWLRANEDFVLQDGNTALWWMLQTAARHVNDAYLHGLVEKAKTRHFPPAEPAQAWKRILDPRAEVVMTIPQGDELSPYQRFFYHAVTCVPVEIPGGDTTQYLQRNMCTPMATKVLFKDPVCTTHHLLALTVYKQMSCPGSGSLAPLEAELLDDIERQLDWDPVMRDPHYQRVLALAWHGRADHIKPIWLRRMMDAQEPDGGWRGYRRIPELPAWMQPWHWREQVATRWPQLVTPDIQARDFHSTAQGVLLLALLLHPGDTAGAGSASMPDR